MSDKPQNLALGRSTRRAFIGGMIAMMAMQAAPSQIRPGRSLDANTGLRVFDTVPVNNATGLPKSSNLIALWRADQITGLSDDSPVDTWVDSINGLVMGGTGSTRPRYRTNGINGKPGIQFSAASGHKLVLPRANAGPLNAATTARKYSIFIVYRSTVAGGGAGMLFSTGLGDSLLSFVGDGEYIGRVGSTQMFVPYAGQSSPTTLGYSSTDVPANGNATGLERMYINGGCVGVQGVPGPQGGSADYAIGNDASGAFPCNCVIEAIGVWSGEISNVDFLQCEKWRCDRLGLPYPWAGRSSYLLFQGNSMMANTDADFPNHGAPFYAAAQLGLSYGQWSNLAIGAERVTTQDARAAYEVDPVAAMTGIPTKLVFQEFFNQVTIGGSTGAQAAALVGTYLANRRAAGITKIIVGTCLDSSGAPTQDLAQSRKADFVTGMLALNPSLYDALVRIDQDPNIGLNGTSANGQFFNVDRYHPFGRASTPNGMSVFGGLLATAAATVV